MGKAKPRDEPQLPADVATVLAELGADVSYIMLWRVENGALLYLGRRTADTFSLDWVLGEHGGGKYQGRAVNGANQFVKSFTFEVDGPKKVPGSTNGTNGTNGNGANGNGHAGGQGSQGMPRWLELTLTAVAPVVAAAIAKSILDGRGPDPILLELLKQRGDKGLSPAELITMLERTRADAKSEARELIEMVDARSPRDSTKGRSWADVVSDTVPEILSVWRREQDQRPSSPPRARALVASDQIPVTDPSATGEPPAWLSKVRFAIPMFLKWADAGKTPDVKAEGVLDDLGEDDINQIAEHVAKSPTFVADVLAAFPELRSTPAREQWFTAFLEHIVECLTPEEEDAAAVPVAAPGSAPGMPSSTPTPAATQAVTTDG